MSHDAVTQALDGLPGVHRGPPADLRLRVQAPSFLAAIALVEAVGRAAEELDHHPDIDIRWRSVTFILSTHSAGGVTELDVELASRILALAGEAGASVVDPTP